MKSQRRFSGRRRLWAFMGALAVLAGATSPVGPAVAVDTIDWLDHSFGGGLQTFDLSAGRDPAADVAVQADGKVLVAATAGDYSSSPQLVVFRFLPDGRPDTDFGTEGKVAIEREGLERAIGLAVEDDGRIVVAATGDIGGNGIPINYFFVARLEATGTLDPTFATTHVDATIQRGWLSARPSAIVASSSGRRRPRSATGPRAWRRSRSGPTAPSSSADRSAGRPRSAAFPS